MNIFFVLSGFLITGILVDTREDPYRARNFFLRRTLRIFPLFYAVLLAVACLWPLFHWQWNAQVVAWPLYAGNFLHFAPEPVGSITRRMADFQLIGKVHGHKLTLFLGHFWSLCIEEQFYLLWPWLVFSIRSRRVLLWLCGLSLPVCLLLRLAATHVLPAWMLGQNVLSRFTPLSCDGLLFGGFLALLLRGRHRAQIVRLASWLFPPYLFVCLALAFGAPAQRHLGPLYTYPSGVETLGFTVLDGLGALMLLSALDSGSWLYKLLDLPLLRWAGRLSYGAYVLHDIPHQIYGRLGYFAPAHRNGITVVIALLSTYLLAFLSFRFLESPFLSLKERWTVRAHPSTNPALPRAQFLSS